MATKILIPTPLRPYTDKKDAVEADGATVGELLADLTTQARRAEGAPVQRAGQAAQLRQRLRERRGHPLPAEGADAGDAGRHGQHHSVGGRRRADRRPTCRVPAADGRRAADAHQRRGQALQPPPDHAGGRHGRAAQAEGGEGAVHRRRRPRIAGGDVSRRRRRRHASASSTSTSSTSATCSGRSCTARRTSAGRSWRRRRIGCNALNPHVEVETYETALSSENALELFEPYDVILDGTDNFPTRYLVNDACVLLGKPNAYGSIFRFEGQASVFATKDGPCYRCLYPEPPPPGLVPSCAEGGVLGVLPGHHRRDPGDRSDQADHSASASR